MQVLYLRESFSLSFLFKHFFKILQKKNKYSQPENSEEQKGKIICKLSKFACRRIYVFEHRNSVLKAMAINILLWDLKCTNLKLHNFYILFM